MYRLAVITAHTSPLAKLGSREAGGLNVYVRELARELGRRGYVLDIFTRSSDPALPQVVRLAENARVVHLKAGPEVALEKEALLEHLDEFYASLLRFQREEELSYDLVHAHYWLSGLVGARLRERWQVPLISTFHTLGEVKNRARISEQEPTSRLEGERLVVQQSDRILCASQHEKHLLVHLYDANPQAVAVIPFGVDLELFRPLDKREARQRLGCGGDERIILFVGRIEPLKGIDILLNAVAQLDEEEDLCVFIVGGDERSEQEIRQLKDLAQTLGISERVAFWGAVDQSQLPLFYNAADVCVVPSFYESFGFVALEAMACGTPVVASRVGGLTATVRDGETGYLIPWRCPEPFAERLELLLGNDELRRNLGQAARTSAEQFKWTSVADSVAALYMEAIAEHGGALYTDRPSLASAAIGIDEPLPGAPPTSLAAPDELA